MNKVIITENIIKEIIQNTLSLLSENRESKNINLARKELKNHGYDDKTAQRILDSIRTDIPNSRLGQCKFLLGVVRLYLDKELNDGENIQQLNRLLPYIASEAHINEYDYNLNNLSLNDIKQRFSTLMQQDSINSRNSSYNKTFTKNTDYKIVKIPDYETASQYQDYTSWCVTHYKSMYDNYTHNSLGLFYFCLKNNFENVPKEQGENCPLDEYGLSMIAVSVDENGDVNTITSRWNHEMGGNDSVMTKDELEDLLGVNFYETFKPYSEEEIKQKKKKIEDYFLSITNMVENSSDIHSVVEFHSYHEGFHVVSYEGKYNFLTKERKILSPKLWFDSVDTFREGIGRVEINFKENYINQQGELLSPNLWFDYTSKFKDGFGRVKLNDKRNFINKKGEILSPNLWFDSVGDFNEGICRVEINLKENYINQEGNLLSPNIWFDYLDNIQDGVCMVSKDNKYNYLSVEKGLLSPNIWFDFAYNFNNDIALVKLKGQYSLLNKENGLIGNGDLWFDYIDSELHYGFHKVLLNNKWSYLSKEGKLIGNGNLWFDYIYFFDDNGFADVEIKNNWYIIDSYGNFYDMVTHKPISSPLQEDKKIINKNILTNLITETFNILLENRESKNISLARSYILKNGYESNEAEKKLLEIRNEIPNVRLNQFKFLLGVTRMYLNNEINSDQNKSNLNQILTIITKNEYVNNFDYNFNNLTYIELNNQFMPILQKYWKTLRSDSNQQVFIKNNDYDIISIDSFEEAQKYAKYNDWCICLDKSAFNKYSSDRLGRIYFCLKHGFENIEEKKGENCPLDDYGLSMISVSILENGNPNTISCRWNHQNGGSDHVMNVKTLEKILGVNFFQTFIPYDDKTIEQHKYENELPFLNVMKRLENGEKPENLFQIYRSHGNKYSIIVFNDFVNYMTNDNRILSPKIWFNDAFPFKNGFAIVEKNNKVNFLSENGEIIHPDYWFEDAQDFYHGFGKVTMNNKHNYISENGKILSPKLWFDETEDFINNYAIVYYNNRYNYIDINGNLILKNEQTYDLLGDFNSYGIAIVEIDHQYKVINNKGEEISDILFDDVSEMSNGDFLVKKDEQYNILTMKGNILIKSIWFDYLTEIDSNNRMIGTYNDAEYLINEKGQIINKTPYKYIQRVFNNFYVVELMNNKYNFIDKDNNLQFSYNFDDYNNKCVRLNGEEKNIYQYKNKLTLY